MDLSDFSSKVVLLSKGGIISGRLTFNGGAVFSDIDIENSLINGINIDDFVEDLVFVDIDQVILGKFKDVCKNISLEKKNL